MGGGGRCCGQFGAGVRDTRWDSAGIRRDSGHPSVRGSGKPGDSGHPRVSLHPVQPDWHFLGVRLGRAMHRSSARSSGHPPKFRTPKKFGTPTEVQDTQKFGTPTQCGWTRSSTEVRDTHLHPMRPDWHRPTLRCVRSGTPKRFRCDSGRPPQLDAPHLAQRFRIPSTPGQASLDVQLDQAIVRGPERLFSTQTPRSARASLRHSERIQFGRYRPLPGQVPGA